mgnify:CR=1 FL=1
MQKLLKSIMLQLTEYNQRIGKRIDCTGIENYYGRHFMMKVSIVDLGR